MPHAFKKSTATDKAHETPIELNYEFMAHTIAKTHGISYDKAMDYKESEYWLLLGFENLQKLRENSAK